MDALLGRTQRAELADPKGQTCSEPRGTIAECISSEKEETVGSVWEQPRLAGGGLLVRCSKFRSWKLEEGVETKSGWKGIGHSILHCVLSNNSRLKGRKDANWNEEESSCRLKSREEQECGKALDARLEVFCFVLFLNYASNAEYFLTVQDSSNTHDVNKALSTLSKSPLQRKHGYWIGRYPCVRLETSCIRPWGLTGTFWATHCIHIGNSQQRRADESWRME